MAKNDVNSCVVGGNLVADPELKYLANENAVVNFKIANNRIVSKDKDKVNWIQCVAFGKLAEIVHDHMKQGSKVIVQGEIEFASGKREDGTWWNRDSIICREVIFVGSDRTDTAKDKEPEKDIMEELEEAVSGFGTEDSEDKDEEYPWE